MAQSGLKSADIAGIFVYWSVSAIYAFCISLSKHCIQPRYFRTNRVQRGWLSVVLQTMPHSWLTNSGPQSQWQKLGGNFILVMVHGLLYKPSSAILFSRDKRVHSGRTWHGICSQEPKEGVYKSKESCSWHQLKCHSSDWGLTYPLLF